MKGKKKSAGALDAAGIRQMLPQVPGWQREGKQLVRVFKFMDYHEVMAFVNATAWISHRENHHPDMAVGYNQVTMRYSTHSAGGLTDKDFACAALVNDLLDEAPAL